MSGNKSFGKLYAKTFTGSLYGCGPVRLAVWAYAIANALPPDGIVELNPKMLSGAIGTDEAQTTEAIAYLCAPDPHSRNPEDDGRRLRNVSGFQYKLVNFTAHRNGRDDEERRAYNRIKQREHRQKMSTMSKNVKLVSKTGCAASPENSVLSNSQTTDSDSNNPVKQDVIDISGLSAKAEAEAEAENNITPSGGVGVCSANFESFWNCYPRKVAKHAAIKAFKAAISKIDIESMLKALATQKQSQQWQKDGGRFIPHPATWLNRGQWADEVPNQGSLLALPVHITGEATNEL